jgi:hemin uptake protein HemP
MDIETAPLLAFVWGMWEQNLIHEFIKSDWFVLTWSAKWLFEKKVYSAKLTPKEAKNQDDKRIMQSMWRMLDEADVVITHNGDKFDLKKLNTRFLVHRMNPPMPYISIDTLKSNKKQFAHTSNKLDYINNSLGVARKMKHEGASLWVKCYNGDSKSLDIMEKYNIQDVVILEDLYLRIRQWIKPHPNLALHITDERVERCPTCLSDDLRAEKKHYYTKTARYEAFRCNECGAVGRHRKTVISRERSQFIKISV